MSISLEGMSEEQIAGLARVAKSLGDNPKTREGLQRLMKENNPDLMIPEIDIPERFRAELEHERTERKAIQTRLDSEAMERRILASRQVIIGKGVPEDEVSAVEKLMVDRGIVNHETAAEFHMAQKRMAEPTPPAANVGFGAFELPNLKNEAGMNSRQVAKNIAMQMWNEFKAGKAVA